MGKKQTADMAQAYQNRRRQVDVPRGAVAMVQVIVFEDGTVHVGAPALAGFDEDQMVHALTCGLELMGYSPTLEDSDGDVVEVTGIHSPLSPTEAIA